MEFSSSNIKKILIFSQKKAFLIFPEMKPCTFQRKLEKSKKSTPRKFIKRKLSYTSGNKPPDKISYNFSKKNFLIFWKTETPKKFFIFQETETLKNALYFRKGNFLIF